MKFILTNELAIKILLSVFLFGCEATVNVPPPLHWSRNSTSVADFYKDRYSCLQEAQSDYSEANSFRYKDIAASTDHSQKAVSLSLFQACMLARGYKLDPTGPFVPPLGTGVNTK